MSDNWEYRELLRVHTDVNKLNDFLHLENERLRDEIKAAMDAHCKEDYDETYHILYRAIDPKFQKLDVHR